MPRQSDEQKNIVRGVMHDFKHGELESSSGDTVKSRKQAIAIALHEAGASNQESPAANSRNLHRTRQAGDWQPTRAQLYEEAKRKGIKGRSRMSKTELSRALSR